MPLFRPGPYLEIFRPNPIFARDDSDFLFPGYYPVYNPPELWIPWGRNLIPWNDAERDYFIGLTQNTPEWLRERKNFIGGSTIGALAHCSKYKTAPQWVREHMNFYSKHWVDPTIGSHVLEHGHIFEPVVQLFVEKLTGLSFTHCGIVPNHYIPWLGISPDALSPGIVAEFKAPQFLPLENLGDYAEQGQAQMDTLDVDKQLLASCWVSKAHKTAEITIQMVERSPEYFYELMIPLVEETLDAREKLNWNFQSKLVHTIVEPKINSQLVQRHVFTNVELRQAMDAAMVPLEWQKEFL